MLVEAWLQQRLATKTEILTILGADKVFPVWAPQTESEPFITFTKTSVTREYTMRKNNGEPTSSFTIACWDTDYARLKSLADATRQAIDGYRSDATGFSVRKAFVSDEQDIFNASEWGFEQPIYGVQFTLDVTHTETVPTYT